MCLCVCVCARNELYAHSNNRLKKAQNVRCAIVDSRYLIPYNNNEHDINLVGLEYSTNTREAQESSEALAENHCQMCSKQAHANTTKITKFYLKNVYAHAITFVNLFTHTRTHVETFSKRF